METTKNLSELDKNFYKYMQPHPDSFFWLGIIVFVMVVLLLLSNTARGIATAVVYGPLIVILLFIDLIGIMKHRKNAKEFITGLKASVDYPSMLQDFDGSKGYMDNYDIRLGENWLYIPSTHTVVKYRDLRHVSYHYKSTDSAKYLILDAVFCDGTQKTIAELKCSGYTVSDNYGAGKNNIAFLINAQIRKNAANPDDSSADPVPANEALPENAANTATAGAAYMPPAYTIRKEDVDHSSGCGTKILGYIIAFIIIAIIHGIF